MASASDNFNRTENPISDGGAWTTGVYNSNNVKTDGSVAIAGTDADYNFAIRNSPSFSADHYSEAVFDTTTSSQNWVIVRASGSGGTLQFYGLLAVRQDANALHIYKYTGGGGFSLLASASSFTPSDGTYRLEVNGTTLTGYFGGVSKVTVTNSDIASGQPGIGVFTGAAANGSLDNWAAADLGGGGGGATPSSSGGLLTLGVGM